MDIMVISAELKNPNQIDVKSDMGKSTDCLNETVKLVEATGGRVLSNEQTKEFDPHAKNPAFVNVSR